MADLHTTIADELRRHQLVLADDEALQRVVGWAAEAQKHGQKTNLIGTMEPRRIAAELVADSLMIVPLLDPLPARIVDIGAGAGIPGLILCAALDCAGTLVEPRLKRTMFLRHCARTLGLGSKVHAHEARIETLPPETWSFDGPQLWVSRAVFAPAQWLSVANEHAQVGDRIALWCNGHLPETAVEVPSEHLRLIARRTYSIAGPGDRTIFLYEKHV